MKTTYWYIYSPEYGYFLGNSPEHGIHWGYKIPKLFKTQRLADKTAVDVLKDFKNLIVMPVAVDLPYDMPEAERKKERRFRRSYV